MRSRSFTIGNNGRIKWHKPRALRKNKRISCVFFRKCLTYSLSLGLPSRSLSRLFETKDERDNDSFRVSFSLAFTFKFCVGFFFLSLWTFQYSIVWTKQCCSRAKCKRTLTLQNIYVLNCVQNWCANFVQRRRAAATASPIRCSNVCVSRHVKCIDDMKSVLRLTSFFYSFSSNFFSYCLVARFTSFHICCSSVLPFVVSLH